MPSILPAYAKDLAAARKSGKVPARGEVIVALDLWPVGKPQHGALPRCLIPDDRRVEDADLSFLAGLSVIAAFSTAVTAAPRIRAFVRALLAVEPLRLLAFDVGAADGPRPYWIKSASRGVEVRL